jgi:hypothetical protein
MNCYNHITQSAVAQCSDCGKGLCPECASCYSIPICNMCNKKRISGERSRIITEMLLTFGLGLLLTVLFLYFEHGQHPNNPIRLYVVLGVMFFYIFSGIIPGWKTLIRITPNVFLFLPLIGWLMFFIVKFILAIAVGLIMLPIRTVRNIYRLGALRKISV